MPELPDVEVFRRRVARHGLGRRVRRVRVPDPAALRDVTARQLGSALRGRELTTTHRHGKHLFARVDEGSWLVMHFGMTGFAAWLPDGDADQPSHLRAAVEFDDGSRLVFADQRRLGFVSMTDDVHGYVGQQGLGPDALELGFADLRDLLEGRRGGVKSALMDQGAIAGIGNVYSDEILFHARIHPRARSRGLGDASYRRLHRQVGRVLRTAADKGADSARMPRTWLLPHREDNAPCPRGRGEVHRISVSGRSAFLCPECQPPT